MLGRGLSSKLVKIVEGVYRPSEDEVLRLAEIAKLNKLYLAFLRSVDSDVLREERLVEEARFMRYVRNVVDVVKVLKGLRYALYKFRKPVDHVSVDLDLLIHVDDVPKAVARLRSIGFEIVVVEPYTVTLRKGGFIVDLYTHPAFAWIVYMDGQKLLQEHSEDMEIAGVEARGLTREAEAVVTAAHAAYKEHVVLLLDCITIRGWLTRKGIEIAKEFEVEKSIEIVETICRSIESGALEAPYRIPLPHLAKLYIDKIARDTNFRTTTPNIAKYIAGRKGVGYTLLWRLRRKSY